MRPGGAGSLDPEAWAADLADLFLGYSAVLRLGATVVAGGHEIRVPAAVDRRQTSWYLAQPLLTAKAGAPLAAPQTRPGLRVSTGSLHPRRYELAVNLMVPNRLARDLEEQPELAWALKQDLARGLAYRADGAFLQGAAGSDVEPTGLAALEGVEEDAKPEDLLWLLGHMLKRVRDRDDVEFASAGWIIPPAVLDRLTRLQDVGRSLATRRLVVDGRDGGYLLGYPMIVSRAAQRIFFSADWSEAWIGVERRITEVDVSRDADFQRGETAIRVILYHDFLARRPRCFVCAVPPDES